MDSLANNPVIEWPPWQSNNFTALVERDLMDFPNNALFIHALSAIFLNILTVALSTEAISISHFSHDTLVDLIRGCVIKMRYAHIKAAAGLDEAGFWNHVISDRTATRVWWNAFSALKPQLAVSLPDALPNQIVPAEDDSLREALDHDFLLAQLIWNTESMAEEQSAATSAAFQVSRSACVNDTQRAKLDILMQQINVDSTQIPSRAVMRNSISFLEQRTTSLIPEPDVTHEGLEL